MRNHETFTIVNCKRLGETAKAMHVEWEDEDGDTQDTWLPFSQIDEIHIDKATDRGSVVISKWLAREKGLL